VPGEVWRGVVVSNDGSAAYLTKDVGRAGQRLVVADLATYTVAKTIDLPGSAGHVALTGDGTRLVVPTDGLSIVDTAVNSVTSTIPMTANGVAADAGAHAFASRPTGVQVIDLASNTVISEMPLPLARELEISAARDRLYAATDNYNIVALNPATGAVISTAVVKGHMVDMAAAAASPAIVPDACTYALAFRPAGFKSPPPLASPAGSTDWRIDVIALPDRCTWTAQSDVPWITLEFTNGTGPDNVGISIAPNPTGAARTGTITIGGQSLTISQAGCSNPLIFFERPIANATVAQPFQISGWAIDTCSPSGTGIADPTGKLGYGRARPDVAAAFGPQFVNSGFEFRDTFERRPGLQDIEVGFNDTLVGTTVIGRVQANVLPSIAPFGFIDTPAEGATVSGDMPLTGWVMDDVGLLGNVLIYRDALPGEPPNSSEPGKIFVGVGFRVAGARPDVQALFPTYADNDRAGFGAMILTNALPNGGNGTFTFHVQVADRYHAVWLGPRTVTVDNASSPLPFGAVDTPGPGQTVSGVIAVHGWALTPGAAMIPVDGSTIDVIVDSAFAGHPVYNQSRPDVQALFPGYTNAMGAGGTFMLDTTTLANGLHTIAWVVRDDQGHTKGIGSRFFTVQNP
jgi:hypothetical protein